MPSDVPGADGHYADLVRHPDKRQDDGVVVLRPEAGLFFAKVDAIRGRILKTACAPGIHAVVLDAETVPFLDVTAARMLQALDEDLARDHIRLLIAHDIGQVRDVLRTAASDPRLRRVYPTVEAAVAVARHTTDTR